MPERNARGRMFYRARMRAWLSVGWPPGLASGSGPPPVPKSTSGFRFHHPTVSRVSGGLDATQGALQRTAIPVEGKAQEVELAGLHFDLDFHAGNEGQPGAGGPPTRLRDAGQRVVIRQGDRLQPAIQSELHQPRRGVRAVGRRGMGMQIYHLT